jgi:tRNA pseudouridine38-40 synthase
LAFDLSSESAPGAEFGVLLTVAYDGSPFAGFARQPTERTVAGELDGAVRAVDARASLVRGASRTDSGVHAHGQRVAFDSARDLHGRNWALALNQHLPSEISVVRAARVAPSFTPRFRAIEKTYRYVVFQSALREPFQEGRSWRVSEKLNHERMRAAAIPLIGEHDFEAFRGSQDRREDTVRKLVRIEVRTASGDPRLLEVIVTGNHFMYRMVRIIVGALVDIGRDRLDIDAPALALERRDRSLLGMTAPPDGLYLDHVALDDEGADAWP